ncbi:MAG: hypothetical protein ACI8P3_003947, partial [Saprospiraceae bacterium]
MVKGNKSTLAYLKNKTKLLMFSRFLLSAQIKFCTFG